MACERVLQQSEKWPLCKTIFKLAYKCCIDAAFGWHLDSTIQDSLHHLQLENSSDQYTERHSDSYLVHVNLPDLACWLHLVWFFSQRRLFLFLWAVHRSEQQGKVLQQVAISEKYTMSFRLCPHPKSVPYPQNKGQ